MKMPVRKWHPEKGDQYWIPEHERSSIWENDRIDNALLKDGCVYQTKELAQRAEKALKCLRNTLPKREMEEYSDSHIGSRTDNPKAFKTMSPAACAYWLNEHQEWRQEKGGEMPLSAKELGVLIDRIIELLIQYEGMYEV